MARYTGPVCRLCRREGEKLFLKGDRCYTEKCAVERRSYPPGQHGQGRHKVSEYGLHLREKQKVRRIYGVLERQFERYYDRASRQDGITGENLLRILELRLDNIVYRMGFAASRNQARQLVLHEHIAVNGRKVDIPSYEVQVGDVITVRGNSRDLQVIRENIEAAEGRAVPEWLEVNLDQMEGKILAVPTREQMDISVQEHLIVEYYSR
ncbi:MAG: 30S ribosomal protein S4 [Firmicutes bacterium]|nr:30S ribosomal protein S4 [Bacillota bacterium]